MVVADMEVLEVLLQEDPLHPLDMEQQQHRYVQLSMSSSAQLSMKSSAAL